MWGILLAAALALADHLDAGLCRVKVGKELFTSCGPGLVSDLVDLGYDVFLDLKYHDIPNTVRQAVSAAAKLGVWMLNVHAQGGQAMMQAAREGAEIVDRRPFVIAVTLLTSMSQQDLDALAHDIRHYASDSLLPAMQAVHPDAGIRNFHRDHA